MLLSGVGERFPNSSMGGLGCLFALIWTDSGHLGVLPRLPGLLSLIKSFRLLRADGSQINVNIRAYFLVT